MYTSPNIGSLDMQAPAWAMGSPPQAASQESITAHNVHVATHNWGIKC